MPPLDPRRVQKAASPNTNKGVSGTLVGVIVLAIVFAIFLLVILHLWMQRRRRMRSQPPRRLSAHPDDSRVEESDVIVSAPREYAMPSRPQ
ncbi:hypothetical protein BJX65DRAFT_288466 [Aspergillus insuetus]